jgi:hypothetical protein
MPSRMSALSGRYCLSGEDQELLFELSADPGELCNLAGEAPSAGVLSECRREMLARVLRAESQYPLRTGSY